MSAFTDDVAIVRASGSDGDRVLLAVLLDYEALADGEYGCCHSAGAIGRGECPSVAPQLEEAVHILAERSR